MVDSFSNPEVRAVIGPAIYAAGLFFIYVKKVKNGIVGLHFLAFYERKWLQDRAAD